MKHPLHALTIRKFHEGLLKKEFSALEITQAFFAHIKETDKKIGAYLSLNEERAIKAAEQVDIKLAKDETLGSLAGVPLAIKDNILIEGLPATAASKTLENYTASYDAFVIQRLKSENSVFLGKTNLDEFAMGSSTENSAFKVTRNPHDPKRVPGGSSGGSAAAVAAHLAVAALGSDTGGSVRQPAALCGVVGLKPTYGAVSRRGLIALASSLDQIGQISKNVEDAAILFNAVSGKDELDATSVRTSYGSELTNPSFDRVKTLKVGIPKEYFVSSLDANVSRAVEEVIIGLKSLGITFKEISLPHTKYAVACYYIILPAEASANLARYDGIRYSRLPEEVLEKHGLAKEEKKSTLHELYLKQRGIGLGPEPKRRIILGTFVLSSGYYDAYYSKAQQVRSLIKNDFDEAMREVDIILAPTAPTPAFPIGEKTADPLSMYLSDIFTIPANLAGLPAISIPAKMQTYAEHTRTDAEQIPRESASSPRLSALPVGFQLIGKPFREADILGVGQYYERLVASRV